MADRGPITNTAASRDGRPATAPENNELSTIATGVGLLDEIWRASRGADFRAGELAPEDVALLTKHRLLGWAAAGVSSDHVIRRAADAQAWIYLAHRRALQEIEESFRASGIEVLLLKTAAHGELIHAHPGMRDLADFDLAMAERDRERVREIFRAHGYHPDGDLAREPAWKGNRAKDVFVRESREGLALAFECHTLLFFDQDPEWHWPSTAKEGTWCRRLPPTEHFFHLCLHWGYQHTFVGLAHAFDLLMYFALMRAEIDPQRLAELADKHAKCDALAITLAALARLAPAARLPEIAWRHPAKKFFLRWLSRDFVIEPRRSPIRYFLFKHLLRESWRAMADYDLRWAFWRLRKLADFGRV